MNAQEARIVILEEALREAQSLAEFLHNCLTKPDNGEMKGGYSYGYPEHTLFYLNQWEKLAPRAAPCPHSMINPDCESCAIHRSDRIKLNEARKVLGLKDE
jgi:hypothetical protein